MTNLQLSFNYEQLQIRTVSDAVGIWFALRDVCKILGIKNPRFVWSRLDDDERGVGDEIHYPLRADVRLMDTSSNCVGTIELVTPEYFLKILRKPLDNNRIIC